MPTTLTRAELARVLGTNDSKVLQAFEAIQQGAIDSTAAIQANVSATKGIGEATFVTLSPNDALDNEYLLQVVGLSLVAKDGKVTIGNPITSNGPGRKTFNFQADTTLTFPTTGVLATTTPPGPYVSDAAAAADGVDVGEMYYQASGAVVVRLS